MIDFLLTRGADKRAVGDLAFTSGTNHFFTPSIKISLCSGGLTFRFSHKSPQRIYFSIIAVLCQVIIIINDKLNLQKVLYNIIKAEE